MAQQIADAWIALFDPLKTEQGVRGIERAGTVYLQRDKAPWIDIIVGDEQVVGRENLGYIVEAPFDVKITVRNYRDLPREAEALALAVQTKLEADIQLGGLANWVRYEGNAPFFNELPKPVGGVVLLYRVQYRRKHGAPAESY